MTKITMPLEFFDADSFGFDTIASQRRAFRNGCFACRIPKELNIAPLVMLAKDFRRSVSLNHLIVDGSSDQAISLSLSRIEVQRLQSEEINEAVDRLSALAMSLISFVFDYLCINESCRKKILGRCADPEKPEYTLVFNSYDASKPFDVGMTTHKDMGWINFVYSEYPGLELYINGEWTSVPPMPCHLLVNLGILWEILSKYLSRTIFSPLHRVTCQSEFVISAPYLAMPRTSFVFSLGPTRGNIFMFKPSCAAQKCLVSEFPYSLSKVGSVQRLRSALNSSFDQDEALIQRSLDRYMSDLGFNI